MLVQDAGVRCDIMPRVEMTAPISVPDDGRLRPQDDVPHEDWIADVDRAGDAPEPFFSGRDGDLTVAAAAMDMVSRGRGRGQTLCFSGAPGAGKTSLMRQLVGWTAQSRSDWLPVVVGGQAALSLPAIIDAIDRARASVLSARDIENAVRTEAARLRATRRRRQRMRRRHGSPICPIRSGPDRWPGASGPGRGCAISA